MPRKQVVHELRLRSKSKRHTASPSPSPALFSPQPLLSSHTRGPVPFKVRWRNVPANVPFVTSCLCWTFDTSWAVSTGQPHVDQHFGHLKGRVVPPRLELVAEAAERGMAGLGTPALTYHSLYLGENPRVLPLASPPRLISPSIQNKNSISGSNTCASNVDFTDFPWKEKNAISLKKKITSYNKI